MRTKLSVGCCIAVLVASLFGPVASAQADIVDPATAGPIRTLTYNVCGAYWECQSDTGVASWTAAIKNEVTAWEADVVMLQELCIGQWVALRGALSGYSPVWTSTQYATGCAKWASDGDTRFGLGMFVKAPSVDRFAANLTVPEGEEPRAVLCARGRIDGRTTLACNTHLAQYILPDNGSSQLLRKVDEWSAGLPVILGGDFNAGPDYPALDPIRAGLPGTGTFAEVDENDRDYFTQACLDAGASVCESGEPTANISGTDKKFDHIFLTAPDFHTVRGDAIDPGLSDHKLLRGAAYPQARAPSGVAGDLTNDGRVDMVAVQNEGNLRLYPGLGDGRVGTYRQIGTGGWTNALIAHRGDWTGDGHEDLLVLIGDQLWVYPNTGSGDLGTRIAMRGRPTGWSTVTAIVVPGDVDGDGYPDLVARSPTGLWLHRGNPADPPGVRTTTPIHIGGAEWATLDPLAPGDTNGDGSVDLWARDPSTGKLWLYPNIGGGSLGGRQVVGGGTWTSTDRPLVVSIGDADGNGYSDLWGTTNAGTDSALLFYPGNGMNSLGVPTTVGVGGWQWMLRLG